MIWDRKKQKPDQRLIMPNIKLSSQQIYMRPPVLADWRDWHSVRSRNQEFLKPYEPTWPEDCLSEYFFQRRLERQAHNWNADHIYSFLIFKDSNLIGGMNINNVVRGVCQHASLGYWLDEAQQGQGHMSEAIQLTLRFGFEDLKLHRIHAASLPHNERSRKLLTRAGFQEEGRAKSYLKINGHWQDHILYGFCAEDWV